MIIFSDISLFYYALAADAGVEVGSFNTAWLCEENKVNLSVIIKNFLHICSYLLPSERFKMFIMV